jgi:hypothetical protein
MKNSKKEIANILRRGTDSDKINLWYQLETCIDIKYDYPDLWDNILIPNDLLKLMSSAQLDFLNENADTITAVVATDNSYYEVLNAFIYHFSTADEFICNIESLNHGADVDINYNPIKTGKNIETLFGNRINSNNEICNALLYGTKDQIISLFDNLQTPYDEVEVKWNQVYKDIIMGSSSEWLDLDDNKMNRLTVYQLNILNNNLYLINEITDLLDKLDETAPEDKIEFEAKMICINIDRLADHVISEKQFNEYLSYTKKDLVKLSKKYL